MNNKQALLCIKMMTYLISLAPSRLVQLSPKQQNRIDKIPSPILLEASWDRNRLFHRLLTVGGAPMEAPVPRPPFQKAMTFQFYFMYWYYCNHKLTCSRTDKACATKTGTENLVRKPNSVYWQSDNIRPGTVSTSYEVHVQGRVWIIFYVFKTCWSKLMIILELVFLYIFPVKSFRWTLINIVTSH